MLGRAEEALGLGLGIIAEMAFDPVRDAGLAALIATGVWGVTLDPFARDYLVRALLARLAFAAAAGPGRPRLQTA